MNLTNPFLQWLQPIDDRYDELCSKVQQWSNICSGTPHKYGVNRYIDSLEPCFEPLGGDLRRIPINDWLQPGPDGPVPYPLGDALSIVKRPEAERRAFLCIHTDTVYGPDHPFQTVQWKNAATLHGPGVADAKGGMAVLLAALQAFEASPWSEQVGWEVLLNPDEEIASPGSDHLLLESARRCDVGLVFEPSLPDGNLAGARKGSGRFSIYVHGRAAHAGRDPQNGRNAIVALSRLILTLNEFQFSHPSCTVNVGTIQGGTAINTVPDFAQCEVNVRVEDEAGLQAFERCLDAAVDALDREDGFLAEAHGGFSSPPKPMTPALEAMLEQVAQCGAALGLDLKWRSVGGVCDGNRLASVGLPVVDTLGPVGGALHSVDEYLHTPSLTERAKLSALFLMKWAKGDWN